MEVTLSVDAEYVQEKLEYLQKAIALSHRRYETREYERAQECVKRVNERSDTSLSTTLVAFVGGTGSGKSSLVNSVCAGEYVRTGVLRPTTNRAYAVCSDECSDVLSYCGIEDSIIEPDLVKIFPALEPRGRHKRSPAAVIVDVPDIDSTQVRNREIAQVIIARADIVIWVLDPQKYSDPAVRGAYSARMREIEHKQLVILNQIDRLSQEDRQAVIGDIRQMMDDDKIGAQIAGTSARTGEGIENIRSYINALISSKNTVFSALYSDIRQCAEDWLTGVEADGGQTSVEGYQLRTNTDAVDSLMDASHVEQTAGYCEQFYCGQAVHYVQWPPIRWVSRARFPVSHLPSVSRDASSSASHRGEKAVRSIADWDIRRMCANFPRQWERAVCAAMEEYVDRFFKDEDQSAALTKKVPCAWRIVNIIHWLFLCLGCGGCLWVIAAYIERYTGTSPVSFAVFWPHVYAASLVCASCFALGACMGAMMMWKARRTGVALRVAWIQRARDQLTKRYEKYIIVPMERESDRYQGFIGALHHASS